MLRISEEYVSGSKVVHVAGRLAGLGVGELSRVCEPGDASLHIDLSELLEADEVGLGLLRSLRKSGAELTGVSPFFQLLLEGRRFNGN